MGARPTEIKPLHRRAIIGVTENGSCGKKLIEAQGPMHDIATDKSEFTLEIQRREDLSRDHEILEARRIAIDGRDHSVGDSFASRIPALPVWQNRRDMLAKETRHMRALWGQAFVER